MAFPEIVIPRTVACDDGEYVLNVAAALRLIEDMEMTDHPYYAFLQEFHHKELAESVKESHSHEA